MNAIRFMNEFELLSHYLKAFAYKLTGDASAADDLFQDTALLAFKYRERFHSGTNFKAWLSTIMKNAFINSFRKRKRRGEVLDNSTEHFRLNSGSKTISNKGEEQLAYEELLALVGELNDTLRQPFLMVYQGYKYEEIGEAMNLPIGTIKSRVFAARQFLKKRIKEYYKVPM